MWHRLIPSPAGSNAVRIALSPSAAADGLYPLEGAVLGDGERLVAHTPTASQREINRLITQCLSDLEKEIRELGERVRAIAPPGK